MFWVTKAFVYALAIANAMVSALKTVPSGALLTTPKVRLFSNNIVPAYNNALTDFTTSAFTGYADQALTLSGPFDIPGKGQFMLGTVTFSQTGTTAGGSAQGYVLTDGTSAYYGGEPFPAPFNFATTGDSLTINVCLPMQYQQPNS